MVHDGSLPLGDISPMKEKAIVTSTLEKDAKSIASLASEGSCDVLVILHHPSSIDSLELTEELRSIGIDIPIVVIDSSSNPGFHRTALRAGADYTVSTIGRADWKESLANTVMEAAALRKCQSHTCQGNILCGQLFQTLPVGFALLKATMGEDGLPMDYRYLDMNQEYQRCMGLSAQDLVGLSLSECIMRGLDHPTLDVMGLLDQVMTDRRLNREEGGREDNGMALEFLAYTPCPSMVALMVIESTDVQKGSSESMDATGFFDNSSDLAAVLDHQGRVLRVNRRFLSASGFNIHDLSKTQLQELMLPEERQPFLDHLSQAQGGLVQTSARLRCKDGHLLDIDWSIWTDQSSVYLSGVDRTETMMEEHMMQKGIAISDYLLQMSSEVDFGRLTDITLDLSGAKYVAFNLYNEDGTEFQTMAVSVRNKDGDEDPRSTCALGSRQEEPPELGLASKVLGHNLIGHIWPQDQELNERTRDRTITTFSSLCMLTETFLPKATTRMMERLFRTGETTLMKLDHGGRILGNFIIVMPHGRHLRGKDMLEILARQVGTLLIRHQAEKETEMVNRKLQIIGDVTRHDVLNQVTVLQGYMELMRYNCTEQKSLGHLEKMMVATDNIQHFFEFARQYESLGKDKPQWVPLSELVADSVKGMLPLEDDCEQVSVLADPILGKVFFNLMDNSIRHGAGSTRVRLGCRKEKNSLVILWEDDGMGVEKEKKDLIFQRGFGKNTGFGLFMTKEVLELLGMSISETGTYGKGARFEIRVPMGMFRIDGRKERRLEAPEGF